MNTQNKSIILILMLGIVAISPTALLSMKRKRDDSSQSNSSHEEKDHTKKKRRIEKSPVLEKSPVIENTNIAAEKQEKPLYEIVAQERLKEHKIYYDSLSKEQVDKEYNAMVEEYKGFEENLESFKKNPLLSIWGGLNYAMTMDEMKQVAREKFCTMKKNEIIISKADFEKVKADYFIPSFSQIDLTRVWGADYLKEKINKSATLSKDFDVPAYVIVVDKPNEIKVKITTFYNGVPPQIGLILNGNVYFKKISGTRAATSVNQTLCTELNKETGFYDFSDPGNIIRDDNTKKLYIVDTEYKSFQIKLDKNTYRASVYLENRFLTLQKMLGELKISEIFEFMLED